MKTSEVEGIQEVNRYAQGEVVSRGVLEGLPERYCIDGDTLHSKCFPGGTALWDFVTTYLSRSGVRIVEHGRRYDRTALTDGSWASRSG